MSRFNISGLGSGLDTQSIIAQLLDIERQPIIRLQGQKANLTAKSAAFGLLNTRLLGLQSSLSALTQKAAFNPLTTTSTDSEKVTASATSDAIASQYAVSVTALAQSHKLSSSAFGSRDQGLNISGQFIINGKSIQVAGTDSLNAIATKINAANAGAQATILSAGNDQYYLNLTSTQSGAEGELAISDADGGLALQNLGVVNTTQSLRHSISGGGRQ